MLESLSLTPRAGSPHSRNTQGRLDGPSRTTERLCRFNLLRPTIFASALFLGAFAGTTVSTTFAQDVPNLFSESVLPSDADVTDKQADSLYQSMAQDEGNPTLLRSRHVKAQMSALKDEDRVGLNLFNDEYFVFEKDQIKQDGKNGYVVHGKAMGKDNSDALFTVEDDVMVGNVRVDGKTYQIRYAGNGIQTIREVDEAKVPESTHPMHVENEMSDGKAGSTGEMANDVQMASDLGDVIDVMVVYTPAARTAAGGTSAIKAEIKLAIEETNQAYANSRVTQRLRLVYSGEVAYTVGANNSIDLNRLTNKTDGYMDNVHTLRDTYRADLVSLWTTTGGGIAWLMSTVSTNFESHGFSVTNQQWATSNYVFAHELGHNMGAHHDRNNAGSQGAYSYSYGYNVPAKNWRTIMSYNCSGGCARIPHFSNPNVNYNGDPTGRPSTASDSADNARTFNNTDWTVANFRQAIPDPPPLLTPVPDTMLPTSSSTVTFTGKHASGDLQHWIYVGTTGQGSSNIVSQNMGTSHSATVGGLPTKGTIYVRYWTRFSSGWKYMDHTYFPVPRIISPVPGDIIASSSATFTGTGTSADLQHWIFVGTSLGSSNIRSQNMGLNHSVTVTGLPSTGNIYVRYWTRTSTGWKYRDHFYNTVPGIITPAPGSYLFSSTATFTGGHTSADLQHWIFVGTTGVGSSNIRSQNMGTGHTATITGLPNFGKVYVRYWTRTTSGWKYKDQTYTRIGLILPPKLDKKP